MAITETLEKRRLMVTLGAHEAPSSWEWECVRFLRNDDGSEAAPPQKVTVPATAEEAAAHIGEAMVKQREDIAADTARYSELRKAHEALTEEHAKCTMALDAVKRALGVNT